MRWQLTAVLMAGVCHAQTVSYDASLGTLPEDQGWDRTVQEPVTVSLGAGELEVSSMPFTQNTCDSTSEPQFVFWRPEVLEIDFAAGARLSARLRVVASQYEILPCVFWYRPGFSFALVSTTTRQAFWSGLGESRVFLSNDFYAPSGSPAVVEAPLVTTDAFHDYELEVLGTRAVLSVDGVPLLELNELGPVLSGASSWIGDGTVWANSHTLIERFAIAAGGCAADLDDDGDADSDDFFAYLDLFAAGDPDADIDGDGDIDSDDFFAYLDLFAAGC